MPDDKSIGFVSLAVGSVFMYGGIKGYSILKALQNIVQGKPANTGQNEAAISSGSTTSTATGSMPVQGHYDHASLMTLWTSVGGSQQTANNAACHAMQESSGNPNVTSSNPDGGINVGLWQLDTKGVGAGHSIDELKNPTTNATITVHATGNGQNWSEWATPGC